MSKKSISISNNVNHEKSDKKHYQHFREHEFFKYSDVRPTNFSLFLFFMSMGLLIDEKEEIDDKWDNVPVGKSASDVHVDIITAISHKYNETENFNKPTVLAREAEQFAKAGLHYFLKQLEDRGLESFVKYIIFSWFI